MLRALLLSLVVAGSAQAETLLGTHQWSWSHVWPQPDGTPPNRFEFSYSGGGVSFDLPATPDYGFVFENGNRVGYDFVANIGPTLRLTGSDISDLASAFAGDLNGGDEVFFWLRSGNNLYRRTFSLEGIWNNYMPPDGKSLLGTGLHLSAVEFDLTQLEPFRYYEQVTGPEPYLELVGLEFEVAFELRLYGESVPEPASLLLLLPTIGCALTLRSRRGCRLA